MSKRPESDFNAVAGFYDTLASIIFGNSLKTAQEAFLNLIPENADILIVGGGTGWILSAVVHQTKPRKIVYLEASEKMLQQTKLRLQKVNVKQEILFIHGTENNIPQGASFDIIITNFLLDLFKPNKLHNLIAKLNEHLKKDGFWLVTDFQINDCSLWWQKILVKSMYLFFNLTSNVQAKKLPDLKKTLQKHLLTQFREKKFFKALIVSQVYQK